jgi:dipeptidase E
MRLFLSSQDLGKHADLAARMAGENKRAAYVRNSQDHLPPEERNRSTSEKKKMFEQAGFEFEEVDLRNYFGKTTGLEKKLEGFGSIWCAGGNTFVLRRALAASGLDSLLIKWLKEDKIFYGGWSAGSCVAAHSLKGAEIGDWPNSDIVPEKYPVKETIWEGLGLVPFMIVPHCDQDWYKGEAKQTITYFKKYKLPYKALNDGEVVIVDGDKTETLK